MKKIIITLTALFTAASLLLSACQGGTSPTAAADPTSQPPLRVLAVETFLADIAQNVAGDRLQVEALIPLGLDPHAFEPTPQDVARIAASQVLILNGAGFEAWASETLQNAGGERRVIEASAGLASRTPGQNEVVDEPEGDPHFWLDPLNVVQYVENIRQGLVAVDPAGEEIYTQNATAYIAQLNELNTWIEQQVGTIPPERRQIVTNHESFGYFADRYGFQIIGTIIPSVSSESAPSAQELARLTDAIRASGVRVIFLETGSNPVLAEQLARETGVKVVADLYTHSISTPDGEAPTYIAMMRHNVNAMVAALKE